jgi:hypothetical protein
MLRKTFAFLNRRLPNCRFSAAVVVVVVVVLLDMFSCSLARLSNAAPSDESMHTNKQTNSVNKWGETTKH